MSDHFCPDRAQLRYKLLLNGDNCTAVCTVADHYRMPGRQNRPKRLLQYKYYYPCIHVHRLRWTEQNTDGKKVVWSGPEGQ